MTLILDEIATTFGGLGSNEVALECAGSGLVPSEARGANGQNETEKMVAVGAEDGVGLCSREISETRDLRNPTHVVPCVEVEWLQHLIGGDRHLREELNAVSPSSLVERHDPVEQAIGALTRREL
jgi:hypothetical protein